MAIKGGDLLHVGGTVLIERAQTAGPGQVNLSPEKIYELGNYLGLGTVYDIPDLSFAMDSLDATAQFEAILCGADFGTMIDGDSLNFAASPPLDVLSEIKNGVNQVNPDQVAGSAVIPYLNLESVAYNFGVKVNAKQTATLKGDSLFYNPAGSTAYTQSTVGTATANQSIILTNSAYEYNGAVLDGTKYVLAARLKSGQRLFYGADYTEAAVITGNVAAVTVTILAPVPTTDSIILVYASDTVSSYPMGNTGGPPPVGGFQADTATTPAAIRGKDIEVFIGAGALVNLTDRWTSVQTVTADWKVTLDQDREFSNSQLVSQDFFVPEVSGTIVVKPRNYADLYNKVATTAGLATKTEVGGAVTTVPLPLTVVLHSPTNGAVLKTIYVPDARFTIPGFSGAVQAKLEVTFPWTSDQGIMTVYKGAKAGNTAL